MQRFGHLRASQRRCCQQALALAWPMLLGQALQAVMQMLLSCQIQVGACNRELVLVVHVCLVLQITDEREQENGIHVLLCRWRSVALSCTT